MNLIVKEQFTNAFPKELTTHLCERALETFEE